MKLSMILKSLRTIIKDFLPFLIPFAFVVFLVSFLILNIRILDVLGIKTEAVITILTSFAAAVFKWRVDKENEKLLLIRTEADIAIERIRELESRIDSVLISFQDLRSTQLDDSEAIAELDKKIVESRLTLLQERIELIQSFHREIVALHQHITNRDATKT